MEWFKRQKIGTKLICGFMLVALIGAFIGLQGILKAAQMNELATRMYEREATGIRHSAESNIQFMAANRAIRNAILATSSADRQRFLADLDERLARMQREMDLADETFYSDAGKALVAETYKAQEEYRRVVAEIVQRLQQEEVSAQRDSVDYLFRVARPIAEEADNLMSQLVEFKANNAARAAEQTQSIYSGIRLLLISLTLAGVLVGVLIGVLLTRSLTRQLGGEPAEVADLASRIAAGDLTGRLDAAQARPGSVMYAMSQMQAALSRVVGSVRASSDSIATGSAQIAAGNADLSARTEQQAASLEETAASMEELTATVQQNADNARQANALADDASATADAGRRGGAARWSSTMEEINDSSQRIAEHHQRDRLDRLPDQHPRPQRLGGGGAGRRAGPRLRGGGQRGAQPGQPLGRGGAGDQGPDRGARSRQGRGRLPAGRAGRQDHARGGRRGTPGHRHHRRDRRRLPGAERGHRPGQHGRERRWTR